MAVVTYRSHLAEVTEYREAIQKWWQVSCPCGWASHRMIRESETEVYVWAHNEREWELSWMNLKTCVHEIRGTDLFRYHCSCGWHGRLWLDMGDETQVKAREEWLDHSYVRIH